ncbi:hypothetical protein INT48_008283 [Thamnidium elegans]|uniref:Uncharacterized protein n=1 Tax=Thamnidium elegans TaxID=101142 RepID=A0A8H7SK68_9FUNG|nr:hypothetical protein INT48_008283 [Thamnidium elegans]
MPTTKCLAYPITHIPLIDDIVLPLTPNPNSPLARALTKVRVGVQTHRIKERYLTNEWARLVLQVPVDDSTINSPLRIKNMNRTKGIVAWYEYKFKRVSLSLQEIEEKVDLLRRQKLLYIQQSSLPSPPATRLNF